MNEPKRLLDEGASDLERDLLGAGARLSAPRGMETRVWNGVSARVSAVAVGGVVGGAVAASTTKAAASSGAGGAAVGGGAGVGGAAVGGGLKAGAAGVLAFKTKLVVAALVVAGASTGGALVATRLPVAAPAPTVQNVQSTPTSTTPPTARRADDAPRPQISPPAEEVATASAPPAERAPVVAVVPAGLRRSAKVGPAHAAPETKVIHEASSAPATSATASAAPTAARANEADPAKAEAASQLREDARALQEARAALGAGDPAAAERRLAAISPTTVLGPERDALRVRVAAARGDRARASTLAAAFLRSYPNSPLAPQIEALREKMIRPTPNE